MIIDRFFALGRSIHHMKSKGEGTTWRTMPGNNITAADLMRRLTDEAIVKIQKNIVRDYVCKFLFERSIFILKKGSLEIDGKLHRDYLKSCRPLLFDGELMTVDEDVSKPCMNLLWNLMQKEDCYVKWMQNKRSNTYQAMQHGFNSESLLA